MKPKVVILSAFLSPYRSGAEACTEEVALRLAERFSITIVATKAYAQAGPLYGKVPIVQVGTGWWIDKWLYPFLAPRAVKKLQPDIVHAILETFAGLALHFCSRIPCRRILTLQTTNRTLLKGKVLRGPHAVTAISTALKKIAVDFGRKDVVVIPNGVDYSAISEQCALQAKVPGRILYVGRLEPMKGVDILLTAFANIASSFPRAHLRIVGDGSQRKRLEQLSRDLGMAQRIVFVGFVPVPKVYNEFAQAQIFCGLSRSEALGNVFIEAQAAGCATIGTRVGGIPDVLQDVLVPPDDVRSASDALRLLLSDDAKRMELLHKGQKLSMHYDWNAIAQRYAELYEKNLNHE